MMIQTMRVTLRAGARTLPALTLLGLVALTVGGCDSGSAPPVSSSRSEATVHGKVTVNGKSPTSGEVSFDAANVQRRDVAVVSGPIGKDGTYSVKTLVGSNTVSVRTPETTKDQKLMYLTIPFEAKSGDNTLDITLPLATSP